MWTNKKITKLQQVPHVELLRSLVPFRNCDDGSLDAIAQRAALVQAPKGHVLFDRKSDEVEVFFVVDGEIKVVDATGNDHVVSGGSILSHYPLNPKLNSKEVAIVLDSATVMCIGRGEIENIADSVGTRADREESVAPDDRLDEEIYMDVYQALQSGTLELPSMPSTGVRIAKHLEDPKADSDSIARIIQMDPALTARLIQVANSPIFRGRVQIESCRDAVTRLGQSTTRDLVISFVLKGMFRSRNPILQKRMEEVWQHSTRVAAISYTLARKTPGLDPGQAMLAGLMHDIGVIPILNSAAKHSRVADDAGLLDNVVNRLRGDCGAMALRKWGFAPEFVEVTLYAEDWQRTGGDLPDYADLVIIAQMHSYIGTARMATIPRLDTVPAFHKLALGGLGPGMSLHVLDEAQEEINAMQQVLH